MKRVNQNSRHCWSVALTTGQLFHKSCLHLAGPCLHTHTQSHTRTITHKGTFVWQARCERQHKLAGDRCGASGAAKDYELSSQHGTDPRGDADGRVSRGKTNCSLSAGIREEASAERSGERREKVDVPALRGAACCCGRPVKLTSKLKGPPFIFSSCFDPFFFFVTTLNPDLSIKKQREDQKIHTLEKVSPKQRLSGCIWSDAKRVTRIRDAMHAAFQHVWDDFFFVVIYIYTFFSHITHNPGVSGGDEQRTAVPSGVLA